MICGVWFRNPDIRILLCQKISQVKTALDSYAWTVDKQSTTVPRVYYKSTGTITNDMFRSRYLQNGAYWKIANVEFGYNLPEGIFGENGFVRSARIYVSGQNLYTLSKYRGYNIDFAGGAFTPGYNYCSYPAPVTGMLGVKLSF